MRAQVEELSSLLVAAAAVTSQLSQRRDTGSDRDASDPASSVARGNDGEAGAAESMEETERSRQKTLKKLMRRAMSTNRQLSRTARTIVGEITKGPASLEADDAYPDLENGDVGFRKDETRRAPGQDGFTTTRGQGGNRKARDSGGSAGALDPGLDTTTTRRNLPVPRGDSLTVRQDPPRPLESWVRALAGFYSFLLKDGGASAEAERGESAVRLSGATTAAPVETRVTVVGATGFARLIAVHRTLMGIPGVMEVVLNQVTPDGASLVVRHPSQLDLLGAATATLRRYASVECPRPGSILVQMHGAPAD